MGKPTGHQMDLKKQTGPSLVSAEQLHPPPIPDHELLRRIGRGSYGEVWLARSVTGAYRAVKIVYRKSFDHDRPFDREFAGILKFEPISRAHETQVDILHVGRAEGCFFYVMELADDQFSGQHIDPDRYAPKTLKSELFQRGQLPFEECVQLSLALTAALENLHNHGLVHRDIKPSNIIFVKGIPKLADIGLVTGVDATRSYVGTEGFAAPEGPGTAQSDIYSLGKVLYELCTGRDRQDFPELPSNLGLGPDWAGLLELNAVIAKACREDPRQRYASAQLMREELLLLQSGKSLARLHAAQRVLARLKRVSVIGAALTTLTLAALVWQWHQARQLRWLAARIHEANGIRLINEGRLSDALPSLVEALKLQNGDREKEKLQRVRLGAVLGRIPRLVQLWTFDREVNEAKFSPDGRFVATACSDGTARVWDVATGKALTPPLNHGGPAHGIAFSPDGRQLATCSGDQKTQGDFRVWETLTGRALMPPVKVDHGPGAVSFSPDGALILTAATTADLEGEWRLWDAATGEPRSPQVKDENQWVHDAAFSPDGRHVLLARVDGTAKIWDVLASQIIPVEMKHPAEISGAAYSPDGLRVVTGGKDNSARLWDVSTGQPLTPPLKHDAWVFPPKFSPDGERVLTFTRDEKDPTARVWSSTTGDPVSPPLRHPDAVTSAEFSPDGRWVLTASKDKTVRVWDATTGELVFPSLHLLDRWSFALFSPDGRRILVRSGDHTVRVWDLGFDAPVEITSLEARHGCAFFSPDGRRVMTAGRMGARVWDAFNGQPITPHLSLSKGVAQGSFSPDGRWVVTPSFDGTARVRDAATGAPVSPLLRHRDIVMYASFSPDSHYVVTASQDRTARVWDAQTGEPATPPLKDEAGMVMAVFSPDGKRVLTAACGRDFARGSGVSKGKWATALGDARIWDARTGQLLVSGPQKGLGLVGSARFSPDGRRVVSCDHRRCALIWDAETGKQLAPSLQHNGFVQTAEFSPSGDRVITGSSDGTAMVWNTKTGEPLTPPLQHTAGVLGASFSPDGFEIITTCEDQTVRVWDAQTGELLTPPLEHIGGAIRLDASFSPDGKRILSPGYDATTIWTLAPDMRPVSELEPISEIIALGRLNEVGAVVPLDTETLTKAWQTQRLKHPASSGASTEESVSWHEHQAFECEWGEQWFAARLHLARLLEANPKDQTLRDRYEYACENLKLANKAEFTKHLPNRDPRATAEQVDLSQHYNALLNQCLLTRSGDPRVRGNDLAGLPAGLQQFAGVLFDVRGVVQLRGEGFKHVARIFPQQVSGIKLNSNCRLLHFLNGTGGYEEPGQKIGSYQVHYVDGRQREVPIIYGEDLLGWWMYPDQPRDVENAEIAWSGTNSSTKDAGVDLYLYKRTWKNPLPDVKIASIDFSSSSSNAAPFLLAITLDQEAPEADGNSSTLTVRFPTRDPRCAANLIDLSRFYNASFVDGKSWQNDSADNLRTLPRGPQVFAGSQFDVRGIVQLARSGSGTNWPEQVAGITVGCKCRCLNFLHAADFFADSTRGQLQIGSYRVHYANGQQNEIPIIYGEDVRDWHQSARDVSLEASHAMIAWTGWNPRVWEDSATGTSLRLFKSTWQNPAPDVVVTNIDFISAMKSAAPFLVAITAE